MIFQTTKFQPKGLRLGFYFARLMAKRIVNMSIKINIANDSFICMKYKIFWPIMKCKNKTRIKLHFLFDLTFVDSINLNPFRPNWLIAQKKIKMNKMDKGILIILKLFWVKTANDKLIWPKRIQLIEFAKLKLW